MSPQLNDSRPNCFGLPGSSKSFVFKQIVRRLRLKAGALGLLLK